MNSRLLIGIVVFVAAVAGGFFATRTDGQSGRNRQAQTHQNPAPAQDDTPALSTDDVGAVTPIETTPVGHGPSASDVAHVSGPIAWGSSFTTATKMAKADQVIFVDVYTDWCGWCKYMDQQVYTDPRVQSFAAKQVFVKLNAEDRAEGTAFAERHGVRAYPTLLVFAHDGRLIASQPGAFRRSDDFLSWLRQASSTR
jgi:thiol:disulfide interchange protein